MKVLKIARVQFEYFQKITSTSLRKSSEEFESTSKRKAIGTSTVLLRSVILDYCTALVK